MPEVSGSLILKLPENILFGLNEGVSNLDYSDISIIFQNCGLDPESEDLNHFQSYDFSHEGIERRNEYLLIYPFDEDYMALMKLLVQEAKNIEIYGLVSHEYGITEYYALTGDGKRFVGHIDQEGDEEATPEEVRAKFSSLIPRSVRESFPEVFGSK